MRTGCAEIEVRFKDGDIDGRVNYSYATIDAAPILTCLLQSVIDGADA